MAHTMNTISAGAAATLRISLNTIDTVAALALPVHQAGQRCGRRFRPIIAAAWQQIDWQEVLTIVITGLAIVAIASWRFSRWAHRTLISSSAALGQRYAAWLAPAAAVADHQIASRDPQPAMPIACDPQPAAASAAEPKRTRRSKLPTPAPKPSRKRSARNSQSTKPAMA